MNFLGLMFSALRRLITAISSPFRMLLVRVQRLFNVNIISAKLITPLTNNVKKLFKIKPKESTDYVSVGRYLVFKQAVFLVVIALCAGVFIYFQTVAKAETPPDSLTGVITAETFRYDDIALKDFTGVANIKAYDGDVVYIGDIAEGICTGKGTLYDRDGLLVYEGDFDNNKYNGNGIRYYPEGSVQYEGAFVDNLYSGAGNLYALDKTCIYMGDFAAGKYEGEGKLYDGGEDPIYEGMFLQGKRHGWGTQYYDNGVIHYQGEFFQGAFQGQGKLFDKNGQLQFEGPMYSGDVNYASLLDATLADVETAFNEIPCVYYNDDGSCCFFFEKNRVAFTVDCRVKVNEWIRKAVPDGGELPEFIDRTKEIYFEIDRDIWQSEDELDKTKVSIRRVTVISEFSTADGLYDNSGAITLEDCVAIDSVRVRVPTAFSNARFDIDRQNKLIRQVWRIDNSAVLNRMTRVADDITYRYCFYEQDNSEIPAYYSLER